MIISNPVPKAIAASRIIALLLLLPFFLSAQTEVRLMRQVTGPDGEYCHEERQLTGAAARQFQWPERAGEFDQIVIHRGSPGKAKRLFQKKRPLLLQTHSLRTTDEQGMVIQYARSAGQQVRDDEQRQSLYLMRQGEGPSDGFPNLYLEEQQGRLHLTWVGSGECPPEANEYELDPGDLRIELLDGDGGLLLERKITTTVIGQPDDRQTRIVEIETAVYPHRKP